MSLPLGALRSSFTSYADERERPAASSRVIWSDLLYWKVLILEILNCYDSQILRAIHRIQDEVNSHKMPHLPRDDVEVNPKSMH